MVLFANSYLAAVHFDQGAAAMNANDFVRAVAAFDECLAFKPSDLLARWHVALSLLSLGDYVRGFSEYECRWDLCDWTWGLLGEDIYRIEALPPWRGEPLDGKRVLVQHEQGYGDAIMALRYLPVLQARGAEVTALMPPPLQRLVSEQFNVAVTGHAPRDLDQFDYRCPLFGVMQPLAQTPSTIPDQPYITPQRWRRQGGKIGIAWSGRSRRELTLDDFLALFTAPGARYSLQLGPVHSGVIALHADDFADTVEVIAQMDHIVTIDTVAAHLAGAMGHPSVHVVLPWNRDWRWYQARAWYPTINVYPQPRINDWAEPFARITNHINQGD